MRDGKLGNISKDAVVTYLKLLLQYSLEWIEENYEYQPMNPGPFENESGAVTTLSGPSGLSYLRQCSNFNSQT
jgi:hypothetical protein